MRSPPSPPIGSREHYLDAIYTGYLGSFEQIHLMQRYFEQFKTASNFTFVDPAMGDNGKLYPAFDEVFAHEMAKLVAMADICVPNLTEACMMLDLPYREVCDETYYKEILPGSAIWAPKRPS